MTEEEYDLIITKKGDYYFFDKKKVTNDFKTESYWNIITKGKFKFFWWVPKCTFGIYRLYYDGWHLSINLYLFALTWEY